jgi:hypothetical protein
MGGDLSVQSAPGTGSKFKLTFVAKRVEPERVRRPPDRTRLVRVSPGDAMEGAHRRRTYDANRDAVAEVLEGKRLRRRARPQTDRPVSRSTPHGAPTSCSWTWDAGMNGLEAHSTAEGRRVEALIIGALTAGAFGDDEREALRAGRDFFMRKALRTTGSSRRLSRVLEARGTAEPGGGGALVG